MVLAMAGMFVAAFVGGSRFMWKICREALLARRFKSDERVLIIGAGEAGVYAAKLCQEGRGISGTPVGFVSDEADMRGERLYDLPVLGDTGDIPSIIQRRDVTQIVIAMPDTDGERIADIVDACRRTRCKVRILSDVDQTATRKSGFLREVNTSDFLSRGEVRLDTEGIRGYLTGRVVLVTGGGGSIGSEICRQVMRFSPKQLIIFDIYENCAYELERELQNRYGQDCPVKVLIGSIRDKSRLDEVFAQYRPEIVFHAAAHKHVPLMETSPAEAIKNNVAGTRNLLQSASEHGVKRLVQLSTDKAVNPTNVMGATKRFDEMIVQYYAQHSKTVFTAVRFGNVLGSHGSVIPLFKRQLAQGGPITVTHKDITRYFMTIPEASRLVITAGALAKGGEIFVLNMGEPVRIYDLAVNLVTLSGLKPGRDIEIKVTGLRPGEKMYEELLMDTEKLLPTENSQIRISTGEADDLSTMKEKLGKLEACLDGTNDDIKAVLADVVPTYHPQYND